MRQWYDLVQGLFWSVFRVCVEKLRKILALTGESPIRLMFVKIFRLFLLLSLVSLVFAQDLITGRYLNDAGDEMDRR